MSNFFVGITTTLSAGITSTSSSISISDATASGLNIGDYIMVNDEMMRIKNTSINEVFRGVFGTKSTNHISGTQIKKVRVVPVESRRNSLIRAANQTFEYVGFGQGNYSVALPEKQTKVLSTEDRKLGQTQKEVEDKTSTQVLMMLVNTSSVTRLLREQQVKKKYLMHLSQL